MNSGLSLIYAFCKFSQIWELTPNPLPSVKFACANSVLKPMEKLLCGENLNANVLSHKLLVSASLRVQIKNNTENTWPTCTSPHADIL